MKTDPMTNEELDAACGFSQAAQPEPTRQRAEVVRMKFGHRATPDYLKGWHDALESTVAAAAQPRVSREAIQTLSDSVDALERVSERVAALQTKYGTAAQPEFHPDPPETKATIAHSKHGKREKAAAQPLYGGDERAHVICLCPDCVKPRGTEAVAAAAQPEPTQDAKDAARMDWLEQAYADGARHKKEWAEFMRNVAAAGYRTAIDVAIARAALKAHP